MKQLRHKAPSSVIILIRPIPHSSLASSNDYEILIAKRSPNTMSGGYWAFPGGHVEDQDYLEEWDKVLPDFIEKSGKHYHDFNKRVACIRELYEECNLFISDVTLPDHVKLSDYEGKYEHRFAKFCKDQGVRPAIDKLLPFRRFAPPVEMRFAINTQNYLYFCDDFEFPNTLKNQRVRLNEDELTDYIWVTVDKAL